MTPPNSVVEQTVKDIKSDVGHDRGLDAVRDELDELRDSHMKGGKLDEKAFTADLREVSMLLHKQGVLPRLDFVATNTGDAAILGISGDGKPDGKGQRITQVRGNTFEYDKNGHVTEYSLDKGESVWKYSKEDGQYHEHVDGKPSGKTTDDAISVDEEGRILVTHADGSTTQTMRWGAVIERNAEGKITEERRKNNIRTFQYEDGRLVGMSDFASEEDKASNNATNAYVYDAATQKFYSATDTAKSDPLDIKVIDKKGDRGTVLLTHQDGSRDEQRLGGTVVHWNADDELTGIEYRNGNKAADFTYNDDHELTGFNMTGKDGVTHTYTTRNGKLVIDEGTPQEKTVKGKLTTDDNGVISVTEVGDGSDDQFKRMTFRMGGAVVESGLDGVTRVIHPSGRESTFHYNSDGELDRVDAHDNQLQLKNGEWFDAEGKPVKVKPKIQVDGTFLLTAPDGSFDGITAGGIRFSGQKEPQPPDVPAGPPGNSGDIAADLLYWSEKCVGKKLWTWEKHSEVEPSSTRNGYYGCSASVSAILGLADLDRGEEDGPYNSNFLGDRFGKTGLASRLATNLDKLPGWDRIRFKSYSQLQPGDIIQGIDSNGVNGHIGIVGPKVNGQWTVYENSSSRGRWEQHSLDANFAIGNSRFDKRMWIIRPPD